MVCIVCPKGCRLKVDEENGFTVTGNSCEKGAAYGRDELSSPTRTLTSTVKLTGGSLKRCPIRTSIPIPKSCIPDAMAVINRTVLTAPVRIGQTAVKDLLGTGADVVVTRDID